MEIEFYEEFPTKENLNKLKLIKFKTRLFIAAKSIGEFQKHEKNIQKIKRNIEIGYWPIIENSYWISPFSNNSDLKKIFNELRKIKNPLLIDLELPLKRKRGILENLFYFKKNKKLIEQFLKQEKNRITTAQYPFLLRSQKALGLDYDVDVEKSYMYYTSMLPKKMLRKFEEKIAKTKDKKKNSISLGTTAIGILGNEPILTPKNLEKDLNFVESLGFKKAIIFRLGGLNKEYIKIINKFVK